MEIFRAENEEIIKLIYPHLVEAPDFSRELIADHIIRGMIESPDNICVAAAFDGEELVGYTIGWVVRNHIWLGQSWLDVNYDRKEVGFKAIQIVKDWALEKDIHDIRFETMRSAKALTKAWGFEEFSSIMRMEF